MVYGVDHLGRSQVDTLALLREFEEEGAGAVLDERLARHELHRKMNGAAA